jgi:hypothetical protein
VAARARRRALIVASVPDEVIRIIETAGIRRATSSARSTSAIVGAPNDVPRCAASTTAATTSGCAWPWISGPHEQTQSTYRLPSTSTISAPLARSTKIGVRPIARIARTGELTPPGRRATARA